MGFQFWDFWTRETIIYVKYYLLFIIVVLLGILLCMYLRPKLLLRVVEVH